MQLFQKSRLLDKVCSQFLLQKFKRGIFYLKSFDCCLNDIIVTDKDTGSQHFRTRTILICSISTKV